MFFGEWPGHPKKGECNACQSNRTQFLVNSVFGEPLLFDGLVARQTTTVHQKTGVHQHVKLTEGSNPAPTDKKT